MVFENNFETQNYFVGSCLDPPKVLTGEEWGDRRWEFSKKRNYQRVASP